MKKILFSTILFGLTLLPLKSVYADTTCQPIYGGGQTCVTTGNIAITKTVQNPQSGGYVANLNINDPKFTPGQTINFQVTVMNNDSSVNKVTVKDTFPQFIKFVSGPGSYDSNSNTLTFDVNNLSQGQSQTFTIQGKVVDASQIPFTNGTTCTVNQALATANTGQTAQSNSQFCITNQVTTKGGLPVVSPAPVKTTPPTGPEELPLLALIPSALTGFFLRKKTSK